jgi:hypothetical protein
VKTWLSMGIKCTALDCVHALHGDLEPTWVSQWGAVLGLSP